MVKFLEEGLGSAHVHVCYKVSEVTVVAQVISFVSGQF